MKQQPVLVVGAGVGGLAAAIDLAARGVEVVMLERAVSVGGKLRELEVAGRRLDVGPTVLTMRHVFDQLFEDAGASLEEAVRLERAHRLARHAWTTGGPTLDLFSDLEETADAIGVLAGPREARGYRLFAAHARRVFEAVEEPFLASHKPSGWDAVKLARRVGLGAVLRLDGHRTLWRALQGFFADPRLLQLFGRYATYCGSSPFLAPATLAVIAHVEREGVWLVEGGMARLADALRELALRLGVTVRTGETVESVEVRGGRAVGVRLAGGTLVAARAVVWNGDVAALATGLAGGAVRAAVPRTLERSLSAITFATVARTRGLPLVRHTVVFSRDSEREFRDLFDRRAVPDEPTVYVCAQDRDADGVLHADVQDGAERLLALVNAPATGDVADYGSEEIERCERRMRDALSAAGLELSAATRVVTTPRDFHRAYPATGGALYGPATHGMTAPFARSGAKTALPGLFLCGGSAHPGAGVPMVATSGRLTAASVMAELGSTHRSRPGATAGGTSTS